MLNVRIKSFHRRDVMEDGRQYCVGVLMDDSTFGQACRQGTDAEIIEQLKEAALRVRPPTEQPSEAHEWDGVAWVLDTAKQAKLVREGEIDTEIQAQTIGGKTLAELKAMTRAEYGTWFDANFDTQAKLIGLLKRLTLILIRRVL